jgi:hypothetical protein
MVAPSASSSTVQRTATTTMRYMHLSSAACQDAIALLNARPKTANFGDIVDTALSVSANERNR